MKQTIDFSYFWSMTGKVLNSEASQEENRLYHEMLLSNQELMDCYLFMKSHWNRMQKIGVFSQVNTREDWLKVKASIEQASKVKIINGNLLKRSVRITLMYAAAISILFILINLLFFNELEQNDSIGSVSTISAPIGSPRVNILLPDGSNVWLNAGSTLKYSDNFDRNNRNVSLSGEAFFEVRTSEKPFIVSTGEINIRVLGTSFNIKAYEDDEHIEATLVSGSLLIEKVSALGHRFDDILLDTDNQKAIIHRTSKSLTPEIVDEEIEFKTLDENALIMPSRIISKIEVKTKSNIESETGWKDGILVVEREPLQSFVRKLERRYDVSFVFEDENLKDYNYTGRLQELTLEQVLHAIKLTSPIDYSIVDRTVTLRINPDSKLKYQNFTRKEINNKLN